MANMTIQPQKHAFQAVLKTDDPNIESVVMLTSNATFVPVEFDEDGTAILYGISEETITIKVVYKTPVVPE